MRAFKFCFNCGQKTKTVLINCYNPNTGIQRTTQECVNPKCPSGCLHLYGRHDLGFLGWASKCRRCGAWCGD